MQVFEALHVFQHKQIFLFQIGNPGRRQAPCIGRNQKLHDAVVGECGISDQHTGHQLPAPAGPTVSATQGDGVKHQPS